MRNCLLPCLFFLSLAACQKELHFPSSQQTVVAPEKLVQAIVVADTTQNDYDSIVYRYNTNQILEIHYGLFGDSITRTYSYDAYGRLSKIEDQKAIYYTNNDMARRIVFQYNGAGDLVQTTTDFNKVNGIVAHFTFTAQGNYRFVVMYDTSYSGPGYDLDWANRIIYDRIDVNDFIIYDSCFFFNNRSSATSARVQVFNYDGNMNAIAINKFTYQNNSLTQWGQTTVTTDLDAPIYEKLRKKIYSNLANWYETSSVGQDDNYRPFSIPGGVSKKIAYAGYSDNGGPSPQQVTQVLDYKNYFDGDLLLKSDRDASISGQGSIYSRKQIRYYYK